jgi:hypothetical protein
MNSGISRLEQRTGSEARVRLPEAGIESTRLPVPQGFADLSMVCKKERHLEGKIRVQSGRDVVIYGRSSASPLSMSDQADKTDKTERKVST